LGDIQRTTQRNFFQLTLENNFSVISIINTKNKNIQRFINVIKYVNVRLFSDLSTIKSNYQMFNSTKSISFSLYVHSVTKINIFINDEQNLEHFPVEIKNIKKWNHYAISVHNNNVYVLENDQIIRTTVDFNPYEFVIKSKEDIFWKIHNCKIFGLLI
jgi:hypothetical protein